MTAPTPQQLRALANTAMEFAVGHFDADEHVMAARYEQFEVMLRAAADQLEAVRSWLNGQDSAEWDSVDLDALDRIMNESDDAARR